MLDAFEFAYQFKELTFRNCLELQFPFFFGLKMLYFREKHELKMLVGSVEQYFFFLKFGSF